MNKTLIAVTLGSLFLSGCVTQEVAENRKEIRQDMVSASSRLSDVGSPLIKKHGNVIQEKTTWMPVQRVQRKPEAKVVSPELMRQFSINRTFFGINDVAERISLLTGIPVAVSPDALTDVGQPAGSAQTAQTGQANAVAQGMGLSGMPPLSGAPGLPSANSLPVPVSIAPGSGIGTAGAISLSYNGTLAGFLDAASARFGVSWAFRDGRIEIFRFETKTFELSAVPGDVSVKSTLTSGGTGAAGATGATGGTTTTGNTSGNVAGGGSMETSSTSDLSVWRSVESSVKAMLSSTGRVVVTPATGSITVTDYPRNIAMIEKYIDTQNAMLTKQVVVNVRVLSVNLTDTHNYGINWSAVYQQLSSGLQWKFLSGAPIVAGAATIGTSVISSANGNTHSQKWEGSEAVIQALSAQGNVSVLTSSTNVTLNNQPVPVRVGKQLAYLQSSSTSQTANVGSTATLTPGILTTGFSMNLLPHIQPDGKLLMQYAIDLSSLIKLTTVTSGDSTIQTPEVETRNFMQRVAMRSGDTIVMSGFEQGENNDATQGIGSATNVAFGGAVGSKKARTVIVVLLTANIVDKI